MTNINYQPLIDGEAHGELLVSRTGLSFWGGVDPSSGLIIDQHHPLHNQNVSGKILALPSGRGSSSGSGVILELLHNDVAPAALVFIEPEDILTLGVLVSEVMFQRSIPVCRVSEAHFKTFETGVAVQLGGGIISCSHAATQANNQSTATPLDTINAPVASVSLSESDTKMLSGDQGEAAKLAMEIVVRMAGLQGATELIDVTQAHIDACVYNGPSSLMFAQKLASLNGQVRIPTTLNSLSVDKRCWKQQGVREDIGTPASQLGDAYLAIGAQPTYTCAPYLLNSAPEPGQQIVWAESNAVMYANSVLGARTQKYPDFLDACIALTARAPCIGAHLDQGRLPSIVIRVDNIDKDKVDDSFWPLLGYRAGTVCQNKIPIIFGLEDFTPTQDDHKAFSAAFATTSSVPMYHMAGQTPEAEFAARENVSALTTIEINFTDLISSWDELNSASDSAIDVVCLGNPHFSATECARLASLCTGRNKHPSVAVIVTLGRDVFNSAKATGSIDSLETFGVQFIHDTCWCMIEEPVIPVEAKVLMTNSGKYAHYGPGLVKRPMHFGSLSQCVDAACNGSHDHVLPDWQT